MNQPTPAIVAQSAVRRLPRLALLLFCVAYVLPGFLGREPWKSQDITAFGYMLELAQGQSDWLKPTLVGQAPEFDALLPYWLGAWAMQIAPAWLAPELAARLPFAGLLAVTLVCTWYGIFHLARTAAAQPVAFAFGGEAEPTDYARAMADAGLLALIACLGLAQLSHETTPALAQLGFTAMSFYGLAALAQRPVLAGAVLTVGVAALALSGAPSMAVLFTFGGAAVALLEPVAPSGSPGGEAPDAITASGRTHRVALALAAGLLAVVLASAFGLWRWRLAPGSVEARSAMRLLLWFTWPAWPLALWTLWRWRHRLDSRHVALPLWFVVVSMATALSAAATPDRSLLLGLPALAALAAFALPTLRRSVSALIDWFTLLFFSGCALVIWVVWISLQTGVPAKPAANVAKLAAGYVPSFSPWAFGAALAATLAWAALVRWRAGRHRAAIWKSLVLPAGGAALCWLLLMTLWLPVLDYARSYAPVVRGVVRAMDRPGCVTVSGLSRAQIAALRHHGALTLRAEGTAGAGECPWLVTTAGTAAVEPVIQGRSLRLVAIVRRPTDARENLTLYRVSP